MRVQLKGVNASTKQLADGSKRTYWYAWKGGPRLSGQPGSLEFAASYHTAVEARSAPIEGTLQAVLDAYEKSSNFRALAPRSQRDYRRHLKEIEAEFGDFPLEALEERGARRVFLNWRDKVGINSPRSADYKFSVLARALSWGLDRGMIPVNPCRRPSRLYQGNRSQMTWSVQDEAAFLENAPQHLHLALLLALWTGQRQGDLLRLPWSAYDGEVIRLRQRKTRASIAIPVGAKLKVALDQTERRADTILTTAKGKPWSEDGFRTSWGKACAKAGIRGLTFHDLRGTAVTRLALAGCSTSEIATVTGHSLRDAEAIIDSRYLRRDPGLAISAIKKLEATEFPTAHPTGPVGSNKKPEKSQ